MVHTLIPAHNNKPEVLEVLGCLEGQRHGDLTVLLVDDGSTDGTGEEVRRRFPRVRGCTVTVSCGGPAPMSSVWRTSWNGRRRGIRPSAQQRCFHR